MKSKEIKDFPSFKKALSILCILLSLFTLCALTSISVSAEEVRDFSAENYKLTDEHYILLGEEINNYSKKDTSNENVVSKSVTNAINVYRKELTDLQTHEDVSSRLLNTEVTLSYSKGKAVGMVAWIYYYNMLEIKGEAARTHISALYESYYAEIDTSSDAGVLDRRVITICDELNREIYKEKIAELKQEDDLPDAKSIVEVALRQLPNTSSSDIDGGDFALLYSDTVEKLYFQRKRDYLYLQFKELFFIINGTHAADDDQTVLYLLYELKLDSTIPEMNESFKASLKELTDPLKEGIYTALFIDTLSADVTASVNQASHNDECVNVRPHFESFVLSFKKAQTKDSIALLFGTSNDELKALESEFNADGGLVDKCGSAQALELELIRANYRKRLSEAKQDTLTRLSVILGEYDKATFSERISSIYSDTDLALCELTLPKTSFEAECELCFNGAKSAFSSLLNEAQAERFLLDHKTIINKPKDELEIADEIFLQSAINDFLMLGSEVKASLKAQINSIAEKYNILTNKKILSLSPNDAFYLDLCELLSAELKNLSAQNIDVFYNNCNLIYTKAQALHNTVIYYREISAREDYQSYNTIEKSELNSILSNVAQRIANADISNGEALATELDMISDSAKTLMNRTNECVRLRVATRGSDNVQIKALVAEARTRILSSTDKSEMISIADKAIFKINRELTKDEITKRAEKQEYIISEMKFLSATERTALTSRMRSLKTSSYNDASLAENVTVLSFIWNSFSESAKAIFEEANMSDLSRARESYLSMVTKESEKFTSTISGMLHITSTSRAEFLNSSSSIITKFKTDIALLQSTNDVISEYAYTLEQLNTLSEIAASENLYNYKEILKNDLIKQKDLKNNYSEENYNKLETVIQAHLDNISSATTLSDSKSRYQKALSDIEGINTLLDDAKSTALRALDATFNTCRESAALYSTKNLQAIESFYNEAREKIYEYTEISDTALVNETLNTALALMSGVRKDMLFTSERAEAISNPKVQYPTDYSLSKGYWGCLISSNGILSNANFSISTADAEKNIQTIIRRAAKSNSINVYGSISDEKLKMLKKCVVTAALDLRLSDSADSVSAYTVRMLIPADMAEENILGIVFVDENNNVEFYNVDKSNSLISFDLSHFSKFYIVSENTTNLLPLIIFLTVILILELFILALILLWRFRRKRKEENMFPLLSAFAPSPFLGTSALAVQPQNGVGIAVFLSVAVIALGCGIAMLTKLELKAMRQSPPRQRPERPAEKPVLPKEKKHLLKEKQEIPVLCAVGADGENATIDVEEEIYAYKSFENESDIDYDRLRKAEINLDSIAEQFEAGDLVTLELLKKKRLVRKHTDYVKILARGSLTKPLVIEAHDFSRAAEEMLKAVGGEAIRVKP